MLEALVRHLQEGGGGVDGVVVGGVRVRIDPNFRSTILALARCAANILLSETEATYGIWSDFRTQDVF